MSLAQTVEEWCRQFDGVAAGELAFAVALATVAEQTESPQWGKLLVCQMDLIRGESEVDVLDVLGRISEGI